MHFNDHYLSKVEKGPKTGPFPSLFLAILFYLFIYLMTAISLPNLSPLSINPKLEYKRWAPLFSG